jgi:hypothetical protein
MIPEERVRRALLNVERREVVSDITQIEAAILHLEAEGKNNYDAAKNASDRQEDYCDTSDKILKDLQDRLDERNSRLDFLESQLALLSDDTG